MPDKIPPGKIVTKGIDVSAWQTEVDWNLMLAMGKKFTSLKASQGISKRDKTFAQKRKDATKAGLIVGAYHFWEPTEDATLQAGNMFKATDGVYVGELPHTLDMESYSGVKSIKGFEDKALEFLEAIESQTKMTPWIYSGYYFLNGMKNPERFAKYPIWIAAYNNVGPMVPKPWTNWNMWQYTSSGEEGIKGNLDLDMFNGSEAELRKYTRKK